MDQFNHLFPPQTATAEQYTYPKTVVRGEFKVPPRDDRQKHATRLIQELQVAEQTTLNAAAGVPDEQKPKGIVLDFASDAGFKLQLEGLEHRQRGIELCNSRTEGDVMHATVFVPKDKLGFFVSRFEAYAKKDTPSGKPKHKEAVESVSSVRLAALASFWTDAGALPQNQDESRSWEVWLRDKTNPHDVTDEFRQVAAAAGLVVSPRQIRFPERRVLLARGTLNQLSQVANLFDMLAEFRLARRLAGEFVDMPPREQAELIAQTTARISPPDESAPAVCEFDTGVNRGHPLLQLALAEKDLLACDPAWSPADVNPQQHGTAMAGIALYGPLTDLFATTEPIQLRHRLESVKILPDQGANDPDLYGEITQQGISRIEIAAPNRPRAICLTVTADSRDEGLPSSWSGAVDQISSGAEDGVRRLFLVAAGNTPADDRHNYPDENELHGVEDPAQAFNVLTVGAYTERSVIQAPGFEEWQPIAQPGQLSPSSRTSLIWRQKEWPLKPDIVMEGGNLAIDPATGHADYVDDLMLLTTRVSATGALLTTTADTSAATALAARYAAIIWSHYPNLWPETVRGLLVHSAEWTEAMLKQFPRAERHNRLRCYGYGVPNLGAALWSLRNAPTLAIESELQPYTKDGNALKTKDMHLHRLPWPVEVLQWLGESEVRMRVTLSYFIEPSPGQQGWNRKHRYQSHGLRFDVKRPLEDDVIFHKRLSKAAWEDDGEEIADGGEDRNWQVGPRLRCKGSVHSDTWTGAAAELASCGAIAVDPVSGWWRERPHLERWNRQARYSLVVTLESQRTDVDLYTPIAAQIGVPVVVAIET